MNLKLEMNLDNAAFDVDNFGGAIASVLRGIAADIDGFSIGGLRATSKPIRDENGNTIGEWEINDD